MRDPTRGPTEDEIKQIKRLIADAGGEGAFRIWVRIATKPTKSKQGRPLGLKYGRIDTQLLQLFKSLQYEFLVRKGSLVPSGHAVICALVDIYWRPLLGQSKLAVVKRLMSRKKDLAFMTEIIKRAMVVGDPAWVGRGQKLIAGLEAPSLILIRSTLPDEVVDELFARVSAHIGRFGRSD
jgi:hypothetical protein